MSEAFDATERAVYAALNVPELTNLAPVFQHPPQDQPTPVVIIGDMDGEPFETKGADDDRRISLAVQVVTAGEARKPALTLLAKVKNLLDGKDLTVPGWRISAAADGSDAIMFGDGNTYVGTSRFTIFALKD